MSRVMTAEAVRVDVGSASVDGDLHVPFRPAGLVIFVHGSGSSRHSHRNQLVARVLQQSDFGTLLMDLLTTEEVHLDNQTRELRFDIELLANRLTDTVKWAAGHTHMKGLPIGVFGASTGAAAALVAAARRPDLIRSVVSRGGRPDLAGESLKKVTAPTMLIVGGYDDAVLVLNQQAKKEMTGEVTLKVVPRATHLFEEPGALAMVADYAADWFSGTLKEEEQTTKNK